MKRSHARRPRIGLLRLEALEQRSVLSVTLLGLTLDLPPVLHAAAAPVTGVVQAVLADRTAAAPLVTAGQAPSVTVAPPAYVSEVPLTPLAPRIVPAVGEVLSRPAPIVGVFTAAPIPAAAGEAPAPVRPASTGAPFDAATPGPTRLRDELPPRLSEPVVDIQTPALPARPAAPPASVWPLAEGPNEEPGLPSPAGPVALAALRAAGGFGLLEPATAVGRLALPFEAWTPGEETDPAFIWLALTVAGSAVAGEVVLGTPGDQKPLPDDLHAPPLA